MGLGWCSKALSNVCVSLRHECIDLTLTVHALVDTADSEYQSLLKQELP